MTAKYHQLPQDPPFEDVNSDRGEMSEHRVNYASPFNYSSIFTYDKSKSFKSPFTYSSFSKLDAETVHLEKANTSSVARNVVESAVIVLCYAFLVMAFPLSLVFSIKFVSQFERLVVFRLGRLQDAKGPGAVFILPCIDSCRRVDMRMKAFNVPPLQAITSDGGVVELGATVFYRVKDVLASVLNVQDFNKALRNLAHSVVHRLVNKHPFHAIEKDRKLLQEELQAELNKAAFGWGMEVGNVEMSDMRILRQPEPQVNNALRTLMQPQVMSRLWQAISANGQTQASSDQFLPVDIQTGGESSVTATELMNFASSAVESMQPVNSDLSDLVKFIQQGLSDTLADEIGHCYQIECRGLGEFYMHLKRPIVCVDVGRIEGADVTISLERGDLIDLLSENLSPLDAYLSGRVSIKGDTKAALRMQPLAARLKPFLRANALNGISSSQS